jgi:integrase/recombinase XerD
MSRELFNTAGKRLYLTDSERKKFLAAADGEDRTVRSFCYVLAHTGCRISEALQLVGERIDFAAGAIVFESLKKRKRGVYRAVPVPPAVLEMLAMVHGLKDKKKRPSATKKTATKKKAAGGKDSPPPLWDFGRTTAWKHVIAVMKAAGVKGPHATPKGLRHGFGVAAIQAGIPLNLLQRWLGHAQLTTTAIYANAVGPEERNIAARMWT